MSEPFIVVPFQSTFPRGERQYITSTTNTWCRRFQSTFPRGERQWFTEQRSRINDISIHVPAWGTTDGIDILQQESRYFNPRSRVGNDHVGDILVINSSISIHVPAWGTTLTWVSTCHKCNISIHVPAWGTTANFHKYSLFFYAINIIFLLFIIPSLFSLVLFMLLFWFL